MTTSDTQTDAEFRNHLFDGDQFTVRELAAIRRHHETVNGIVAPGFDLPRSIAEVIAGD